MMPFYPDMEPRHEGTDLELIRKLTHDCASLHEIACKGLVALGWRCDYHQGTYWKPGCGADPPTVTMEALEMMCKTDDPRGLSRAFRNMGWDREERIIRRATEDLPAFIRIANHTAGRN
jgi:hypothetical protein